MIEKLVNEIAVEMSVPLSAIQVIDGRRLGFKGSYLLKMDVNDTVASTILHKDKLMVSSLGPVCEKTRLEIQTALCRLKTLLAK